MHIFNFNKVKTNYLNALNLDKKSLSKYNDLTQIKHYPPANKEWLNSVCQYNKNYIKSLPITDKVINKLFKSYFHLTSSFEKYKIKPRNMRIRNKRLSADRIFLSRAEMKHSNNKIIITLYTYNRTLFCNGLTILRNKLWINQNIFILKKSFFSGILNMSRKFVFSKILANLINPFDGLVIKKIKRAAPVKTKRKQKLKKKLINIKNKIKNLYIVQLLQNGKSVLRLRLTRLSIFNLNKTNEYKIKYNLIGLPLKSDLGQKIKEIWFKNQIFYLSTFIYKKWIENYLHYYKKNIYKLKKYTVNYKDENKEQKIVFKNRSKFIHFNSFNRFSNKPNFYHKKGSNFKRFKINYFKRSRPRLYYLKNFPFLNFINYLSFFSRTLLQSKKINLALNKRNKIINPYVINNLTQNTKNKKLTLFYNILKLKARKLIIFYLKRKPSKKSINSNLNFKVNKKFKNSNLNLKAKKLKNTNLTKFVKTRKLRNSYLKLKVRKNVRNSNLKFKDINKLRKTNLKNKDINKLRLYLKLKAINKFNNFYLKLKAINKLRNFNLKLKVINKLRDFNLKLSKLKLNLKRFNFKVAKLNLKRFNFKKAKFNLKRFKFKVAKLNLNKYNYIFKLMSIKNIILSSYYFKKLRKGRRFTTLRKNTQSMWKILSLKISSTNFVRRLKLINNSSFKIMKKIVFLNSSKSKIPSELFIPSLLTLSEYSIMNTKINNEENILISQSDILLKKRLKSILPLYTYYLQMIYIHNYKYKNWFLLGLKNIMYNIYHKKIEFNIVNLKYVHLSSDILSESMAVKLKNRKNRLLKVLGRVVKLIKIPSLHKILSKTNKTNFNLHNYETLKMHSNLLYKKELNTVMSSINYKKISGIRLEAAGRLTKRLTASRSISKVKYKGNLKNIDSSYKGLSSVMVKGYVKSNIQYTNINSKTRNGSFGLKTWISSF